MKIVLYTGQACITYKKKTDKYMFKWGTADKTAPKFSGLVKGKSGANGDYYRIYYSDRRNTYNYKQFVAAVDYRDVKAFTDKSRDTEYPD